MGRQMIKDKCFCNLSAYAVLGKRKGSVLYGLVFDNFTFPNLSTTA